MQLSTPKWAIAGNLAFCAAINYADRSALSAVLPALYSEMGLSDMELAALGSVFLWSYALFSPVAGFLADRWSRSRLIVISVASWSLVSVAAGFSVNYAMLLTTRILLGLTESLYLPSATALIADYHGTSSRGTAMAVHSVGLNLGVVAGGAGAGYLADHFGWRMGFIVLGGMGLLIAGLSLFFLRDSGAGLPQKAQKHPVLASVGELARIRSYVVVLAEVMLVATGVWTFFNWLPLYFRDTFQMSLGSAGFAGTFTLQIATVAGMVMSGYWSDRLATRSRRNRMLLQSMSFLAAAPFLLVFRTQPGFLLVSLSIFLFALLRGMGQANDSPVLCDVVPSRLRSTAIGFMNTCASFSGGLGVFATGYLKSKYGLAGVFSGISIAFLSAGVILLAGYRFFSARDLLRQGEKQT
ncbi:MAG TPA: MFS transporter [Bryobacteraceae bacterium]|nr:MFS transporter [Bryobacteraceae bacterium]